MSSPGDRERLPAPAKSSPAGVSPRRAALEQVRLGGREHAGRRGAGHGERAHGDVVAAAGDDRRGTHVQQVDGGARDFVQHLLQIGAVKPLIEAHRERLQALQAPRQPVAPLRREALLVEDARLVDGESGEPADAARQLDLLVGERPASAVVEELHEGDHLLADAQRDD